MDAERLKQLADEITTQVARIRGLAEAARELVPAAAGGIEAIVVSGNGPTLVPVDAAGSPLAPALTWMDRRGAQEARIVSATCGWPVDPTFSLPKALWFFRNRPQVYERTALFLGCPEYAAFVLTGAMLATIMSANVLMVIIPGQKKERGSGNGGRIERTRHHGAAHLLGHDDHVGERALHPAVSLRDEHPGPAELSQFLPEGRIEGVLVVHHLSHECGRTLSLEELA